MKFKLPIPALPDDGCNKLQSIPPLLGRSSRNHLAERNTKRLHIIMELRPNTTQCCKNTLAAIGDHRCPMSISKHPPEPTPWNISPLSNVVIKRVVPNLSDRSDELRCYHLKFWCSLEKNAGMI
ncbi:MAG: hypothetical protein Q7S96_02530 [bacterium]|nr:hypothetical protein [bacterium]